MGGDDLRRRGCGCGLLMYNGAGCGECKKLHFHANDAGEEDPSPATEISLAYIPFSAGCGAVTLSWSPPQHSYDCTF